MSDNGSCIVSEEFASFLVGNGITHITSALYHPAPNGLAEQTVQVVKKGLKKVMEGSILSHLAKILMAYRITPPTTTGVSPAEFTLGRQPCTRLDLLKPNIGGRVEGKQLQQKLIMIILLGSGSSTLEIK